MKLKNAVIPLLIANIVVFILQIILGPDFTSTFMLVGADIFSRPWIAVTSMFLHGGGMHLAFNMYVLYIFGPMLESRIGTKRFLIIYFLSGIIASFASSFFYASALGASGAIMGMMGVTAILMPDLKLLFLAIVPMPLWVATIVIAMVDIFGIFVPHGIANIAHLAGLATGLLYGLQLKKQKHTQQKRFSSKTHLEKEDIDQYLKSGRI
ncbi:MAG: rhomboid family intramembrane serine protease [Nanoarchaeota archaeon]|nr:rhomboid family intramembrane serine protease [Nanoarchaeota archaeon]MBU1704046.1 rhomboid family intramembrane serine protease [Nanoarchaeota archaeon]